MNYELRDLQWISVNYELDDLQLIYTINYYYQFDYLFNIYPVVVVNWKIYNG